MARAQHLRAATVVGRDHELGVLDQVLRSAGEGRGAMVFLVGEAGIGKTRLAQESVAHAGELGMRVLRGRGSSIGPMVPFRPLTEVLMSVARAGALPDDDELGPYRAVLGRLIPDWWTPGASRPETSLVVLAEAVLRLLAVLGRNAGCLLVLENLQDADTETLAVLDYLADNLGDVPVTVLATLRDEPEEALLVAESAAQRGAARLLELGRLDRACIARLAAEHLEVDVSALPVGLVDELRARTAGVPFVMREFLHVIVANGLLRAGPVGWQLTGELQGTVPESLVRSVEVRIEPLGEEGRSVLTIAAVLGGRFPLAVVQEVAGLVTADFLGYVRMAARARLVAPDETAADWYYFRQPLTVEALLGGLSATRLAEISGRIADVLETHHPELPGELCQQVATLRRAAGDPSAAAVLFVRAGRRALADGAPGSAVVLLEQADHLLGPDADGPHRLDLLSSLVPALAEVGRLDDALRHVTEIDADGIEPTRLADLHTDLAKAACSAGLWAEAGVQLTAARALLGPAASIERVAAIDVVAAVAGLSSPELAGADPEKLARAAVEVAEAVPLPIIAFDGWQALGLAARSRDLDEAAACYRRALHLAERHRLPSHRVYTLVRLANIHWLKDGNVDGLHRARQDADRLGLVVLSLTVQANLAMNALLTADPDAALGLIDQALPTVSRLKLDVIHRHLLVTRAAAYGHRGQRASMHDALDELLAAGPDDAPELCLADGIARAFCSLAEGNVDRAREELDAAAARESAGAYQLSGSHGLALLLRVIGPSPSPSAPAPEPDAIAVSLRWNRHFALLAEAVDHGRAGRTARAVAAFDRAQEAGDVYPLALHLGRWLVAAPALEDGWADGVALLRDAEEYFRATGATALVGAARARLRAAGATLLQHRVGAERVPAPLRTLGVTVREYEVLELLLERISNKEIAARLSISHRTVEKHIANLIGKTQTPDRFTLQARVSELLDG